MQQLKTYYRTHAWSILWFISHVSSCLYIHSWSHWHAQPLPAVRRWLSFVWSNWPNWTSMIILAWLIHAYCWLRHFNSQIRLSSVTEQSIWSEEDLDHCFLIILFRIIRASIMIYMKGDIYDWICSFRLGSFPSSVARSLTTSQTAEKLHSEYRLYIAILWKATLWSVETTSKGHPD